LSHEERKKLIVPSHPEFSIVEQAELLCISRGSFYYEPKENLDDKKHMDMIDAIYTDFPFYGSRRVRLELIDRHNAFICRERVQRLMRLMGIEAIYPKPKTSVAHPEHKKYPYLLSGVTASFPNHIWGTDITYIRLEDGWAYLVALIDWHSRYVLAWELSLTMETDFCIAALQSALAQATPKIHNSDQGVQFTDREYVAILEASGAAISMDGRGRCMDNIFTERLWRTLKYENIFLMSYRNAAEAKAGLSEYIPFYNTRRRHQSLEYRTPADVYFGK
jgi:putative transposase